MSRIDRVHVTVVLVVVAVIVAALFLTGCGARVSPPPPRVLSVTASGAVSCARADGSGRRVLIVSPQRARSVHVGDVCPS